MPPCLVVRTASDYLRLGNHCQTLAVLASHGCSYETARGDTICSLRPGYFIISLLITDGQLEHCRGGMLTILQTSTCNSGHLSLRACKLTITIF